MIKFNNFWAGYFHLWKTKKVLYDSSFSLKKNQITALSGLNGSGKTTLIKSIIGLNPYTNYNLELDGIAKGNTVLNKIFSIGYAPELNSESFKIIPSDFFSLTNILCIEKTSKSSSYSYENITETFDLQNYADISYKKLSKGTKKRVLIANAILNTPQIIILDEPFEGLDKNQRARLKEILIDIKIGRTILISSHESLVLESFCDDFLHIENNRIIE